MAKVSLFGSRPVHLAFFAGNKMDGSNGYGSGIVETTRQSTLNLLSVVSELIEVLSDNGVLSEDDVRRVLNSPNLDFEDEVDHAS